MERIEVDVAVIGAGTAGLNARREVERRGGRALLIECVRLRHHVRARRLHALEAADCRRRRPRIRSRRRPRFGVHAGDVRIDGPAVMQRVQRERDRFVGFVVADTESDRRRTQRRCRPRALHRPDQAGARRPRRSRARAQSSSPPAARRSCPPPFDALRVDVLTSDDVFELPDLPSSLAVIGTGVIALELGQAMHRLGVRVGLLQPVPRSRPRSPIPRREDRGGASLRAELDLHTGARSPRSRSPSPEACGCAGEAAGESRSRDASHACSSPPGDAPPSPDSASTRPDWP